MHRSGTSAMARVLSIAGAALPRNLIPPGRGNEAGHWEPINVADFNDRLLAKLDSRWDSVFAPRRNRRGALPLARYKDEAREIIRDQFGDEPLIVLKEPRITLLIDFWEDALRAEGFQCVFIVMIRDPEEVAASLKARDQMERNRALLLWATYTSQADLLTRHARRVFCSYDSLLSDPGSVLDSVEEKLEVDLPRRTVRASAEIDSFVQPPLRHHLRSDDRKIGGELNPVSRLADYCMDLVSGCSANEDIPALTRDWLRSLDGLVSPMLLALEDQVQSVVAEAHELRTREDQLRTSAAERDAQHQSELAARNQSLAELQAALDALRAELQQSREGLQAADAAEAEEGIQRAQIEEALVRANGRIGELTAEAQLRAELEQATSWEMKQTQERFEAAEAARIEEASRRAGAEEALALTGAQHQEDLAHLQRLEQQASAAHAAALAAVEGRLTELSAQLAAAAESGRARSIEAQGLRMELTNQLTALAQAREHEADTKLELNGLRGEAARLAVERSEAQEELGRLQTELASQRRLVEDQANALAGYQRSILYRSRDLLLRARASIRRRN
jgi:hypothetical protein